MGNKNFFSSKDGNKIRNLFCLCNRWNPEKEIRGKGSFLITVRVGINREIIFGVQIVRCGKGGNTHSEPDLGVGSDHGVDPDPHRSTRTRTDPEFNFVYAQGFAQKRK